MSPPQRILMVEDVPADRALAERILKQAWPDITVVVVTEQHGLVQALEREAFDLVLTDLELHGWTGLDVIDAARERDPDIPVVMLTGTGTEEIAIEAMKRGVDDYVLKSARRIKRLPAAVELACRRAQERRAKRDANAELQRSEARLRALVEQIPAITYTADFGKPLSCSYVSPQIESILGFPPEQAVANPGFWRRQIHPGDRDRVIADAQRLRFSGEPRETEHRMCTRDGRVVWLINRGRVIPGSDGQPGFIQGILVDITATKQAAEQFRMLLESAPDATVVTGADGRIVRVNEQAEALFGYPRDELLGQPVELLLPERVRDLHPRHRGHYVAHPVRRRMGTGLDLHGRRKDGSEFPAEISLGPIESERGLLVMSAIRDVTEERQAQAEVRESRQRLRNLAAHLQAAREEERTAIAREFHDELGQALTGLQLDLAWLLERIPGNRAELRERGGAMRALLDGTLGEVRRLATRLRPPVLDDLGLVAAIEWQVEESRRRGRWAVGLELDIGTIGAHPERDTALFRIAQEALTNVVRHARARRVSVALRAEGETLLLAVADDGAGITRGDLGSASSLGLIGMHERAAALAGSLEIRPQETGGTVVTARIPIAPRGRRPRP